MKNYEELVDEHLEFMIRLACEAQEDTEIDELIAESQLVHTPEEKEITRNAYLLFQRKLAQQEQKERSDSRRRRAQRLLPRAISVAACLVILLAIATPFAVANISSIRVKVLQMLIRIEERMVLSRVMRKYNSVTYEVGKAKAEQASGMFGLAAGQRAASCPSRVAKPLAKPLTGSWRSATYARSQQSVPCFSRSICSSDFMLM